MNSRELKEQRAELGMTQDELAKRLRINWRTIARYESGEVNIPFVISLAMRELKRQEQSA
jgi:DNA-binding XRE family transcriptional regulator